VPKMFEIEWSHSGRKVFTGPRAEAMAAAVWERCHRLPRASFRIIEESGEEHGTLRPGERHGVHGILTERCADCGKEFRTLIAGASLCPGCTLLTIGAANLARHS
jgi:hypothetical protein